MQGSLVKILVTRINIVDKIEMELQCIWEFCASYSAFECGRVVTMKKNREFYLLQYDNILKFLRIMRCKCGTWERTNEDMNVAQKVQQESGMGEFFLVAVVEEKTLVYVVEATILEEGMVELSLMDVAMVEEASVLVGSIKEYV